MNYRIGSCDRCVGWIQNLKEKRKEEAKEHKGNSEVA